MNVDKFWTFPKIADTTAQKIHSERWRPFTDNYLGAVVGDFWRNHFSQVFNHSIGFTNRAPNIITREVVWRMMGATKPPAFHGIREGEWPDWEALALEPPENYGYGLPLPGIRNTSLVQLLLLETEARDWISRQGKAKRPRGRPQMYDWETFLHEVVRIANTPDGLPQKQADLERRMLQWCTENWGQEPSESTIREKLGPVYPRNEAGK